MITNEVVLSKNYEELAEVIAKTIEIDLEAWLASQVSPCRQYIFLIKQSLYSINFFIFIYNN